MKRTAFGTRSGRTENDMQTFSHILYLDFPAKVIAQRRQLDAKRIRPPFSVNHLHRGQQTEMAQLRDLCRIHGVLLTLISSDRTERVSALRDFQQHKEECPFKTLFSGPLGYSYTAFRQATLLYEEMVGDQQFDNLCLDVALAVTMYPDFVSLLRLVAGKEYVGAVVITCGPRRIWKKILKKDYPKR